ncbi:1,2-phenylacetyl-CoA epoxidase subunit PaaC [Neobacillus notoginsengisoli]|uniref:1,2-phenylacetyl-CoA epoxidase subunit PaaC n=1 Tax=Neobacillus notoginsengisoli TaxID=1578198 RepID=UPI001F00AFE7|nr:1,2-phenylacetyl-CoA epoxidase subunit PaaC [Neobacillus notoginsengisoli]
MQIKTPEAAAENLNYKEALINLLFQLSDDDFIVAYRGSEWLGLAPHIEEDVAFASISQDTMGHAAMFYKLLEDLGVGPVDSLAHARTAAERKNAVLLELVNGPGTYIKEPQYDWAFAVVRHYFYTIAKKIKMVALMSSSYSPLAEAAARVNIELYYHHLHWKTWFSQLMSAGGEARTRMEAAIKKAFDTAGDLFSYGNMAGDITGFNLIDESSALQEKWLEQLKMVFDSVDFALPEQLGIKMGNGRDGQHTKDLEEALSVLSEVYRFDPAAAW